MAKPRVQRSESPTVSTARKGGKKASFRSAPTFTAGGRLATRVDDAKDEHAQVTRDAREVAVAVLANRRRIAISGGAERKLNATSLFLHTTSAARGLVRQNAFLNRVKRLMNDNAVKLEARSLVSEECATCGTDSDGSENTVHVVDELARTRHEERVRNPQPFFEEVVRSFSCGEITAAHAATELQRIGVRATQAFLKRAKTCLVFGDNIPHYSECEDGRGRPGVLSEPYARQLAHMVKYYIRIGVRLSQKTILSCARNFYRDEHGANPPSNALGPAWFHRFLDRNGISTSLYDPLDTLRVNSATEHNVRNFYERLARTAVKHGFARWNPDFDENDPSSQMIIWDESKLHRVFTFDEAKLLLGYEKGVRGVRIMTIRGEDNPRPSVTANDSFAASVMGCRNLAGGALAPYFVTTKDADVADDFDIPGTIIDTTTGKPQAAQWIRGTSKGSFDGFHFATWVKDHLVPCIPNVSPENPAIVICDGHYAHVVDEVLDTCAALGILMVLLPPHCTHLLQGEDLYHFGVFKGAFRVARAEAEAAIQLAAGWFIKMHTHEGVAVSFGQREFWYAVRAAWEGAWTKEAVDKGLRMQGLVPFNRAPLWKHFPQHARVKPERSVPDAASLVKAAERCAERMSIPGAPGLKVIAGGAQSTFDTTFDGSAEAIARAPLNMDILERVLGKVQNANSEFSAEDTGVLEQLILDKQKAITDKLVVPKARKRKTRRYDLVDEATAARVEANLATLKAAQDKRVKRKKREQGAAQDNCDARFTDNSKDIMFVDELRRSLEETGRLDKPLTRGQLMMVMRAKRIPLPQGPNLEFLRNKLKEVDGQLYDVNMAAIAQSNDQRHEKTRSAQSMPAETIT